MSVHAGSIWLDNNFSDDLQDRWVAANAERLVAENRDYDALIAFLQTQDISLQDVTIAYFHSGTFQ